MLRRYRYDESPILLVQDIQVQSDFTYDEELKAILAHEVKKLRNKQFPLVKVLWQHQGIEEVKLYPAGFMTCLGYNGSQIFIFWKFKC